MIHSERKKKFLTYFYEFLVLFASIYVAFELEEWDEEQDFRDREEAYLASMHQDLTKDLNQLNRRVIEYDEKIQGAYQVLEFLEGSYEQNRLEILNLFQSHLQYHFNYNPINNTLETLRTSGDLKLIQNHDFKLLLSELDKSYGVTTNQGTIFNNYIEGREWAGFFINYFDTHDMMVLGDHPYLVVLFRNKIRHYINLIESYYFHMQGSLKKIEEVKLALEVEMKDRNLIYTSADDEPSNELIEDVAEDSLSNEVDDLLNDLESDSLLNGI